MKKTRRERNAFTRGMALALAEMNGLLDQPTQVGEVLQAAGLFTESQLRSAGVDRYDIDRLKTSLREARRRNGRR
jgi:hypothetical protein